MWQRGDAATRRDGQTRVGGQRWRGAACGRRCTARSTSAFSGHSFPEEVIALAGRWDARHRLREADGAEWLAERGFAVARSASYRWVPCLLPLVGVAARRHRTRGGQTWRVDETSCDVKGKHAASYRASDEDGQVGDASCSERRNAEAAQAGFARAMAEPEVTPLRGTTDQATCSPPARRAVLPGVEPRRSTYLHTGLERAHSHL